MYRQLEYFRYVASFFMIISIYLRQVTVNIHSCSTFFRSQKSERNSVYLFWFWIWFPENALSDGFCSQENV